MISPAMRDFLLLHIDGPFKNVDHRALRTRSVAIRSGFVRPDYQGIRIVVDGTTRPRQTTLTEKGRRALAEALADWLEAATKAEAAKDELLIAALQHAAADRVKTREKTRETV